MLLELVMLTVNLKICKSLEGPYRSVCKYENGTKYCCYGFGEDSGTCVECHVGYESNDGNPCVPCQPLMYGKNCAKECKCKIGERCDSVTGRCDKHTDVSTFSHTFQHASSQFRSSRTLEWIYTTEGKKHNDQKDDTIDINDLGLSNKGVVVYAITVAGIFILLFGMYFMNKIRKRICSSTGQQMAPENNEMEEMEEGQYNLIDENNMIQNTVRINDAIVHGYLEVVDRSSDSEFSTDEKNDKVTLHHIQPCSKNHHIHEYENN